MKLNFSRRKSGAMTATEVLVVITCLILAALFLILFAGQNTSDHRARRARRINCISNLRQINVAFRIWEGDNNNQFPMAVSEANGGGREFIEAGHVGAFLQVLSNDLTTTKILVCPADQNRTYATNWTDLDSSHISYFFGADATNESNPKLVFDGDDNLIVGGNPVTSGMLELSTNTPVAWSEARHLHAGNVGFADGSVMMEPKNGLQQAFQRTGRATNRIVIP